MKSTLAHWIRRANRLLESLLFVDQWDIGLVDAPIHSFLERAAKPDVRWLGLADRTTYYADGFGVTDARSAVLLVEQYDYRTCRGRIVAVRLPPGGDPPLAADLVPEVHLSYPFLLRYDGEIYCMPEANEANAILLYRASSFPIRWEKVATLVEDFAGVDPTLVEHDGRWWLFATDERSDPHGRLFVWHADHPVGPWTAHERNPVKSDASTSRPAGTPFHYRGRLYRPAQDCSRTYGGGVAINEVLTLTPEAFEERVAARVDPFPSAPDGLHTVAALGEQTIVDGKRRIFVGLNPYLWRYKMRRLHALWSGAIGERVSRDG